MEYQLDYNSPLISIPEKKLNGIISDIISAFQDDKQKSALLVDAVNRYALANIPVDYWFLDMNDFVGDKILLKKYNELTADIEKTYSSGRKCCFAGTHGLGKQLSLETELPTPNGFVKLKHLKVGDKLFDENGNVCNVTYLHPIQKSPESYNVYFDDGTVITSCADHRWLTHTLSDRRGETKPYVKTTKEIFNTLRVLSNNVANHSIPCAKPINYPPKTLIIDPYVLGCWLGDGTTTDGSIECADTDIIKNIRLAGYSVHLVKSSVRKKSKSKKYRIGKLVGNRKTGLLKLQLLSLNVINNKHIPDDYLYSSYEQRLELLRGLLDTDGHCTKDGCIEFCTVLPKLAEQVLFLVKSLGIKSKIKINKSFLYEKQHRDRHRITFSTQLPVFKLKRKLRRIRLNKKQKNRTLHRYIVSVERTKSEPMRCITVDSPSHLFLVTRSFIATHNTMATSCILRKAVETGYDALYITLADIVNIMASKDSDKFDIRKTLTDIDFLVIDEFDPRFIGSENAADLYGRIIEPIMRTRIQNTLPLFICTNSVDPVSGFSGALKNSIKSLMSLVEIVPVLGKDFRANKEKK